MGQGVCDGGAMGRGAQEQDQCIPGAARQAEGHGWPWQHRPDRHRARVGALACRRGGPALHVQGKRI